MSLKTTAAPCALLLAALFGFGGVASTAAGFAQICFFIFLVLFLVSTVAHVVRRR